MTYVLLFCYFNYFNTKPSKLASFQLYSFLPREDKGDREGIPHTHPIPEVIRLELFLESG